MLDRLPEHHVRELFDQADVDVQDKELIRCLRNWCIKQYPYLPETFYDDTFLTNFILFTKRLEAAKEKLVNFYRAKIEYPEQFMPLDPMDESTKRRFSPWYAEWAPKLTAEGHRTYFVKFIGQPENFVLLDLMKYINMTNTIYLREHIPHRLLTVVIDLEEIKLRHVVEFTPNAFKALNVFIQAVPSVVESLVYINTPNYFAMVANIISNLLKDKIKQRVFVYPGGNESLLNHIPQYVLPIELGGTDYSLADVKENTYKYLVENRQLFLNEINILQKYINQTNKEDKRNSVLTTNEIHGTFKKLDID